MVQINYLQLFFFLGINFAFKGLLFADTILFN